jgi:hypothetical protein
MERNAEADQLRRDLKHYLTELDAVTDPRDVKVLTEYLLAIQNRLCNLEGRPRSDIWAISEPEVWRAAQRMIARHGARAPDLAGHHADALLKVNHLDGTTAWRRILRAINELLRMKPNVGERLN